VQSTSRNCLFDALMYPKVELDMYLSSDHYVTRHYLTLNYCKINLNFEFFLK